MIGRLISCRDCALNRLCILSPLGKVAISVNVASDWLAKFVLFLFGFSGLQNTDDGGEYVIRHPHHVRYLKSQQDGIHPQLPFLFFFLSAGSVIVDRCTLSLMRKLRSREDNPPKFPPSRLTGFHI